MRAFLLSIFLWSLCITTCIAQTFPVSTDSDEARQHYQQAVEHYGNFRVLDAHTSLEQAIEDDADFAMAYAFMGFLELFNFDQPGNAADVAVELSEQSTQAEQNFASAVYAFASGDIEQAMSTARELRDAYESAWLTTALLGNFHLYSGGNAAGLEEILRVGLKHHSDHNAMNNWLGYALRWQGKTEASKAVFQKNIENHPSQPNPYDSMANFYRATGEPEMAAEYYEKSIQIDPELSFGVMFEPRRVKLGNIYRALDRVEDAERTFKEGIGYNPDRPIAYHALGELYMSMDAYDRAKAQFELALEVDAEFEQAAQKLIHLTIIEKYRQLSSAMSSGKAAEIARQFFTAQASLHAPGKGAVVGRASVASVFGEMMASGVVIHAEPQKIEVLGDLVHEYGHARLINSKEGTQKTIPYSVLWMENEQGWQMHHSFMSGSIVE